MDGSKFKPQVGCTNHAFEITEEQQAVADSTQRKQSFSACVGPSKQQLTRYFILRNVFVLSLAFTLIFTAYLGNSALQSSINAVAGLGLASLAATYAALIFSALFLPSAVIGFLGCKWALCICILTYVPYIVAQYYPSFSTLIPAGLLVGFGGGVLWSAQGTYLTMLSECYAKLTETKPDVVSARFFGFFYLMFHTSVIWGNLISFTVMDAGLSGNSSSENRSVDLNTCGANFIPWKHEENSNLQRPSDDRIYPVFGIYIACTLLAAILVGAFMNSLKMVTDKGKEATTHSPGSYLKLAAATIKQMGKKKHLLLAPIAFYTGMDPGFFMSDINEAFISCALGISKIGMVGICNGAAAALCSMLMGYAAQCAGRVPLMALGVGVNLGAFTTMLYWRPDPAQSHVLFILVGLIGFGQGTIFPLTNVLTAVSPSSAKGIGERGLRNRPTRQQQLRRETRRGRKKHYVKLVLLATMFLIALDWSLLRSPLPLPASRAPAVRTEKIYSYAIYGIYFPNDKEASYGTYRLWESVGFFLTFSYSPYLPTYIKLYILLATLSIGFICYVGAEYVNYNETKNSVNIST